jgi:hypothetical protein
MFVILVRGLCACPIPHAQLRRLCGYRHLVKIQMQTSEILHSQYLEWATGARGKHQAQFLADGWLGLLFPSKNGGNTFLQNIGNRLPYYTVSHPGSSYCSR